MPGITTRAESRALSAALVRIAAAYRDETKGGAWSFAMRCAIRQAWFAGRDWGREHADDLTEAPRPGALRHPPCARPKGRATHHLRTEHNEERRP